MWNKGRPSTVLGRSIELYRPRPKYNIYPYPGLTGGSLIGWGGGGHARHRRSVDLEGSGGIGPYSSRNVFINLIKYAVIFSILKYKSLNL